MVISWATVVALPRPVRAALRAKCVDGFLLLEYNPRQMAADGVDSAAHRLALADAIEGLLAFKGEDRPLRGASATVRVQPGGQSGPVGIVLDEKELVRMRDEVKGANKGILKDLSDLMIPEPELKSALQRS